MNMLFLGVRNAYFLSLLLFVISVVLVKSKKSSSSSSSISSYSKRSNIRQNNQVNPSNPSNLRKDQAIPSLFTTNISSHVSQTQNISNLRIYKYPTKIILSRGIEDSIELFKSLNGSIVIRPYKKSRDLLSSKHYEIADAIYGIYRLPYGDFIAIICSSEEAIAFLHPNARKIKEIMMIPIPSVDQSIYQKDISSKQHDEVDRLLLKTFSTHSFYFSNSLDYDITRSYQHNQLFKASNYPNNILLHLYPWIISDQKFFWNYNLNQIFLDHNLYSWITPVTNAWSSSESFTLHGNDITLSLISRRSRKRQGPRYLKRGSDNEGEVANFVMTEQLLQIHNQNSLYSIITSFTQVRGSIPLFWHQPDIWKLKPTIVLEGNQSIQIESLRHHMIDIFSTFVIPYLFLSSLHSSTNKTNVYFINLIDKKGVQGRLGQLLTICLDRLSSTYKKSKTQTISSISFTQSIFNRILKWFHLISKTKTDSFDLHEILSDSIYSDVKDPTITTIRNIHQKLSRQEISSIGNSSIWLILLSQGQPPFIHKTMSTTTASTITRSQKESVPSIIHTKYIWFDYHSKVKKFSTAVALKQIFTTIKSVFQKSNLKLRNKVNDENNMILGSYYLQENRKGSSTTGNNVEEHDIKSIQGDIIRTNCIDCLDRTNVVQTSIARWMIIRQLKDIGIWKQNQVDDDALKLPDDNMEKVFRSLWCDNGDSLSLLYAGTRALKRDVTKLGKRTSTGALTDGMNSMLRYYLNNRVDKEKQRGLDVLLGQYQNQSSYLTMTSYASSTYHKIRTTQFIRQIHSYSKVESNMIQDGKPINDIQDIQNIKSNSKWKSISKTMSRSMSDNMNKNENKIEFLTPNLTVGNKLNELIEDLKIGTVKIPIIEDYEKRNDNRNDIIEMSEEPVVKIEKVNVTETTTPILNQNGNRNGNPYLDLDGILDDVMSDIKVLMVT